ncbi:UNVERIFIED_CONTAM: CSN-associated deubiquitinating enzyme Ubp12 [Siphonaria sp. JEL0065]|nr:CSN-associated deubiquitinating enzyme Ubp12 [Siphonaria sp. JEL0065]
MIFGEDIVKYSRDGAAAFEPVEDLTSPSHGKGAPATSGKAGPIALDDCLKEFMKEEIMGDEDTWYCPGCKEHKKIKKKLDVWSVPDVLVLHLKRFSQTGRGFRSMSSNKIDALVDFPVSGLDLAEFVIGKEWMKQQEAKAASDAMEEGAPNSEDELLLYDLFGVSNHFGGMGGGHYTAYAKNAIDETWYNFDDSHVSKLSSSESVVTPAAYMLFYQRRKTKNTHKLQEMVELRKNAAPEKPAQPSSTTSACNSYLSSGKNSSSAFSLSGSSSRGFYGLGNSLDRPSSPSSVSTAVSDDDDFIGPKVPHRNHVTLENTADFSFGENLVVNGGSGLSSAHASGPSSPAHEIKFDDKMDEDIDGMPGLIEAEPPRFDTDDYSMFTGK